MYLAFIGQMSKRTKVINLWIFRYVQCDNVQMLHCVQHDMPMTFQDEIPLTRQYDNLSDPRV